MFELILIFEGVDKSGKTTLAKALSTSLKIPYYSYKRKPLNSSTLEKALFDLKLILSIPKDITL